MQTISGETYGFYKPTNGTYRSGEFNVEGSILASDGTATDPSYSYSNDQTTGMFRIASGEIGFTSSGTLVASIDGSGFTNFNPVLFPMGTAGAPGWGFEGASDTGMFYNSGAIAFSTGGVNRGEIDATSWRPAVPVQGRDESAAAPTYSWESATDDGIYSVTAGDIGISISGTKVVDIVAGEIRAPLFRTSTTTGQFYNGSGEGMYLTSSATRFRTGNAERLALTGSLATFATNVQVPTTGYVGNGSGSRILYGASDLNLQVGSTTYVTVDANDTTLVNDLQLGTTGIIHNGNGDDISFSDGNIAFNIQSTTMMEIDNDTAAVTIGNASEAISYQLNIESEIDANLLIEADTNNSGEGDNPRISFKQDGGNVFFDLGIDSNNNFTFRSGDTGANPHEISFQMMGQGTVQNSGVLPIFTTSAPTEVFRLESDVNTHSVPMQLASYTVSGVPSASTEGRVIWVSDDILGATIAYSDGSVWRRVDVNTQVSDT